MKEETKLALIPIALLIIVIALSNHWWMRRYRALERAEKTIVHADISCEKELHDAVGLVGECVEKLLGCRNELEVYYNMKCPECPECDVCPDTPDTPDGDFKEPVSPDPFPEPKDPFKEPKPIREFKMRM